MFVLACRNNLLNYPKEIIRCFHERVILKSPMIQKLVNDQVEEGILTEKDIIRADQEPFKKIVSKMMKRFELAYATNVEIHMAEFVNDGFV